MKENFDLAGGTGGIMIACGANPIVRNTQPKKCYKQQQQQPNLNMLCDHPRKVFHKYVKVSHNKCLIIFMVIDPFYCNIIYTA
jgi:hypothetical protein